MIDFLSNEERYFSLYLDELKLKGIVNDYTNDVPSITLTNGFIKEYIKPMKKVDDKVLFQELLPKRVYTPDFIIEWNPDNEYTKYFVHTLPDVISKVFTPFITLSDNKSIVEIKNDFDQNNMTRLFQQNQSWIYDKYNIYINLIKLPSLFKKTFTPVRYMLTDKTLQERKLNYKPVLLNDYIISKTRNE